MKLKVKSIAY